MFLHLLNDKQKIEFLKLGRRMMAADNVVLDSEKAYLFRLFREAGLTASQRSVPEDAEADTSLFDTHRARVAVAVEALVLAQVDGDFGDTEQHVAEEIFQRLEIGGEDRAEIERVATNIAEAIVVVRDMTA